MKKVGKKKAILSDVIGNEEKSASRPKTIEVKLE